MDLDGRPLKGVLISVGYTPEMMWLAPERFRASVQAALQLAAGRGARIVGLGGLIPSFTRYGLLLKDAVPGTGVTTGHSYAAWTIARYVEDAVNRRKGILRKPTVAIVGAAGSTGSLTLRTLMEKRLRARILLVDVPKKEAMLHLTAQKFSNGSVPMVSTSLFDLQKADVIVTVTNAKEAIIQPEHVMEGAVIIDDAQPRNTVRELGKKAEVIDVLSSVPEFHCPFDMGLDPDHPEITFTCLAEAAVLAANDWEGNYSIGRPDMEKVRGIGKMAEKIGVAPAPKVSFGRLVS